MWHMPHVALLSMPSSVPVSSLSCAPCTCISIGKRSACLLWKGVCIVRVVGVVCSQGDSYSLCTQCRMSQSVAQTSARSSVLEAAIALQPSWVACLILTVVRSISRVETTKIRTFQLLQ